MFVDLLLEGLLLIMLFFWFVNVVLLIIEWGSVSGDLVFFVIGDMLDVMIIGCVNLVDIDICENGCEIFKVSCLLVDGLSVEIVDCWVIVDGLVGCGIDFCYFLDE